MNRTTAFKSSIAAGATILTLSSCASTRSVDRKITESQARTDQKIESVAGQVEDLQEKQKATDARVEELGRSAAEALQRATDAGLLAKGKVVFEQTLSEDRVRFKLNSYELGADSKAALDELGGKIKELNRAVFIEIQGHTDDTGSVAINDNLGQQRAESVRRYLARQHQLPLSRMSTISYGDTLPVGSNRNKAGRQQNRRVVVVVLE